MIIPKVPNFELETFAKRRGYEAVAGVDEAGRGPWAGPVVAGAVVFLSDNIPDEVLFELDDSKKLTRAKRDRIFQLLPFCAKIGVGVADVIEIDSYNILRATFLAMKRALVALPETPDYALVDGNRLPELPCPGESIIKGDGLSFSIAAASVVAKVTRDRMMSCLARSYPGYGWERNAGYGTAEHKTALERLGVTEQHRKSFAPIIKILGRS